MADSKRAAIEVGSMTIGWGPGCIGSDVWENVNDHLDRATHFLYRGRATQLEKRMNWYLLAAANSAVAAAEIGINLTVDYKRADRSTLLDKATEVIRHFELLGDLRAQDFHRRAVGFSKAAHGMLGPLRARSSSRPNSSAGVSTDPATGLLVNIGGSNSSVAPNRMIQFNGFYLYDEVTAEWIDLAIAIEEYIEDVPKFVGAVHVNPAPTVDSAPSEGG